MSTARPSSERTARQIAEAYPCYLLYDRDSIYAGRFPKQVREMGIQEILTAPPSNGVLAMHRLLLELLGVDWSICHDDKW